MYVCSFVEIIGCYIDKTLTRFILIGASLSEPHTSVTALQDACVCMSVCVRTYVRPYTENFN